MGKKTSAYRYIDGISRYLPSGISRYLACVRYGCWVKYYSLSFYRYRGVANPWFIDPCFNRKYKFKHNQCIADYTLTAPGSHQCTCHYTISNYRVSSGVLSQSICYLYYSIRTVKSFSFTCVILHDFPRRLDFVCSYPENNCSCNMTILQ